MKRILVVEDETALATGLRFNFEQEGYEVLSAGDGPGALDYFERDEPIDLVVLDLMLPGMSGYEICRAIRLVDEGVPILVLSARTLSEDKAYAFDCGCDQYVTKPFALPELLSRIRNLLERRRSSRIPLEVAVAGPEEEDRHEFGDVTVDFGTYQLHVRGKTHQLTSREVALLRYFLQNDGRVLSRVDILRDVWDERSDLMTRTIDNFVLRLRRMIEPDPADPRHILSVRGTGYRFVSNAATPSRPGE